MAGKTRKVKSKKSSSKVASSPVLNSFAKANKQTPLKVDSLSKIPALENILKEGKVTIVLVFADWCSHCHNFQKNIWNPMCKKNAIHNRVAIRDDMVPNSSLKNSKFDYLPSVLVVNEKGQTESFKTPDGEMTNAMPTPKSLEDMNRIVNVPLTPPIENEMNKNMNNLNNNMNNLNTINSLPKSVNNIPKTPYINEPIVENSYLPSSFTPASKTYTPKNISKKMEGGNLLATLEQVSQGVIPAGILGGLALALKKGGSRIKRKQTKKSKKTRKVKKH